MTEKKGSAPNGNSESTEIVLTAEDEQDMKERITDHPVLGIFTRAGISALMGSIGTAIGGIPGGIITGVIGSAIGFIIDLFRD